MICQTIRSTNEEGSIVPDADRAARPTDATQELRSAACEADSSLPHLSVNGACEMMVAGYVFLSHRWLVLDRFQRDERRFILARHVMADGRSLTALSKRERIVVDHAARGLANKCIAWELGVSVDTVATHLRRSAKKLGVSSRIELVGLFWDLVAPGPMANDAPDHTKRAGQETGRENSGVRFTVFRHAQHDFGAIVYPGGRARSA